MKPVLKEKETAYYVSEGDMIEFISENAPMDWNNCCSFVRDNNICGNDGSIYWAKEIIKNAKPEDYNEEQIKWVGAFFEAHPWIEKMMIVFDD